MTLLDFFLILKSLIVIIYKVNSQNLEVRPLKRLYRNTLISPCLRLQGLYESACSHFISPTRFSKYYKQSFSFFLTMVWHWPLSWPIYNKKPLFYPIKEFRLLFGLISRQGNNFLFKTYVNSYIAICLYQFSN